MFGLCHIYHFIHSYSQLSVCPNQPNFFPPLWRQLERRLTSATMEQLLVSINRLRLTCGFMRLRAFFIPFIQLRFLSRRVLGSMINFRSSDHKTKDQTTQSYSLRVHLLKSFCQRQNSGSVTKHVFLT